MLLPPSCLSDFTRALKAICFQSLKEYRLHLPPHKTEGLITKIIKRTLKVKPKIRRSLLPVLCAAAALAAAISTVKADRSSSSSNPRDSSNSGSSSASGSSAADDTGMGNSYEYPEDNTPNQDSPQVSSKGLTDTKSDRDQSSQSSQQTGQQAGTAADACHVENS